MNKLNTACEITGFLLVDKPNGRTSSSSVQKIRNLCGKRSRVGHAGTLDAFATGLLVVGIGRPATKLLSQVMELDKIYTARAKLGQLTDTLDITGITLKSESPADIKTEQLAAAITSLGRSYKQVPPVYSALKYQGRRISRLARRGTIAPEELDKIVEEKSRIVQLYELTLTSFQTPFFSVKANVSHGTYIRGLMNDIAQIVGTYATTHDLRRLTIGPFSVDQATPLIELSSADAIRQNLLTIEELNTHIAGYQVQV